MVPTKGPKHPPKQGQHVAPHPRQAATNLERRLQCATQRLGLPDHRCSVMGTRCSFGRFPSSSASRQKWSLLLSMLGDSLPTQLMWPNWQVPNAVSLAWSRSSFTSPDVLSWANVVGYSTRSLVARCTSCSWSCSMMMVIMPRQYDDVTGWAWVSWVPGKGGQYFFDIKY